MTRFYLNPINYSKLEHQNECIETGDFVEGCLQDSFVVFCKRGTAFLYEHYLNQWSSDFLVVFVPYGNEKEEMEAWEEWHDFEERSAA